MSVIYVKDLMNNKITTYGSILRASKELKINYTPLVKRIHTGKFCVTDYRYLINKTGVFECIPDPMLNKFNINAKLPIILVRKDTRDIYCFESVSSLSRRIKHAIFKINLKKYDSYTYDDFKENYKEVDWRVISKLLITKNTKLQKNVIDRYIKKYPSKQTSVRKITIFKTISNFIKMIF